ncbi:MAG: type II toxin-antitoxin system HicA family toxin [Melioribacteraceae bacterium]
MSSLPAFTPKKVIKIIEDKGFILDRVKGSHHIFYNPDTKRRE